MHLNTLMENFGSAENAFKEWVRKKKIPLDEEWLNVTYQVYDIPNHPGTFKERLKELEKFVK